jgi:hypothetical protein
MLKLVAAGAIAIPAMAAAAVAATGVAWVDVKEGGGQGHRIVVPVPLLLAEAAAHFVPRPEVRLPPEAAGRLPVARAVLDALAQGPDAELVRIEERGEQVLVSKVGGGLHVEAHGRKGEISVNLPLAAVKDLIREDGTVDLADVVRLLRHARFSTLVDVHDGDDHVRVTVW